MSAIRMDGKMVSAKVRGSILEEVNKLKEQGVRPGLAVIIVGEDPASQVYVRNKERACEECGFYSEKYALPEETTQEQLLELIEELNHNPRIDGILCQRRYGCTHDILSRLSIACMAGDTKATVFSVRIHKYFYRNHRFS